MHDARGLEQTPANAAVFAYLDAVGPPPPGRARDPYLEAGHHPDVVERVWDELAADLPETARCLVAGNPVLAHPDRGVVVAFPRGTAYALWLTPADRPSCGLSSRHRWGNGAVTDLAERLGPGWRWGHFDEREPAWCRAAYAWWDQAGTDGSAPGVVDGS